ncbi:MAG: SurA N-terminal domain-containing protein [Lautropia sp.]|nr:SurA N-terminal domain-containing protein [Lautropia sp.]
MFDFIRTHQRLAQGLLLVLIVPSFVFFGIAGYEQMFSEGDSVGSVEGEPIPRAQFEQVHRQQAQQMQQMMGENFDAAMFDSPAARARVLEDLITRQAMFVDARRNMLTVTPAEVQRQVLESHSDLRNEQGKFDVEGYRRLLAANQLTPAEYEAQIAQTLAMASVERAVGQSAMVPANVVETVFSSQENRRVVRTALLAPRDREAGLAPTDEQLKTWYEKHDAQFELPESVDISYVTLRRDAILPKDATPTDDELKSYFEKHKDKFAQTEEREASHILLNLPEGADDKKKAELKKKAEDLLAQAKASPDGFAELAKKHSEDTGSAGSGGSLGYFTRETMVKPFSDAAFALDKPGFTDVVESEFGYHVIKVTGIRAGGQKALADVKDELQKMWREEEGARRYNEAAEALSNMVYEQADSLKPVAERFKLNVEQLKTVGRRPMDSAPKDSPQSSARLLDSLYAPDSLDERRNTTAIELAPGVLVSARVDAHHPKRKQGLDEVKEEVRKRWIAEEAAKLTREAGEKQLQALKDGKEKDPAGLSQENTVSRVQPGHLRGNAIRAAFSVPDDKLPAWVGADLGTGGYQLIKVEKALPPDEESLKRRDAYQQQLEQVLAASETQAWVEALKRSMKIERKLDNPSTEEGEGH